MTRNNKIITLMLIALVSLVAVGCSDDSSPVATAPVAVDTAPPAVPTGLAVDNIDGVAVLTWDRNTTDSDMAGYVLTRESDAGSIELIASPTLIQSYQDSNVPVGTNVYYVYSVDTTGNQSAGSSIDLVNAGSHDREMHLN